MLPASLSFALVLVAGCHVGGGESLFVSPHTIVERRARVDLECQRVRVGPSGGGSFTARGCGGRVSYVCTYTQASGRLCIREGGVERGSSGARARGIEGTRYVRELAASSPAVERCLEGRELAVVIAIDADGGVVSITGALPSDDVRECVQEALSRVVIMSVPGPTEFVTSFPPPPAPGTAAAAPRRTARAPNGLGPWVDARIAQHRDGILACVGRAVVAVRVEASAAALRWSLQGDLAGSAEEECVAHVVAGEAPPGASGTLIRVVR